MSDGMHHAHKRKRASQKLEPFPHPDPWKRLMDKLIFFVGIAGPILSIPQLTQIWIEKNAAGLSLVTWGSWTVLNVFWILYGVMHKEYPIIITYLAWIIVNLAVVVGILTYG